MRRAFYAGAAGMFLGILASIAPKNEPTDEDLQMMTGINNELLEFALSVKKGSA